MKRLVLIAVAMLVAGVMQASTIVWGTSSTVQDNLGGNWVGDAYLVYLGSNTSFVWGQAGDTIVANATGYGDGTLDAQNYTSNYAVGSNFAEVFTTTSTGNLTLPTSGYYISVNSGTVNGTPGTLTSTTASPIGIDQFDAVVPLQTSLPIPEPCTMALAFVGAGAMALRRRFAKKS
jgi:hypothetical protein